jgi:hypothetical protein
MTTPMRGVAVALVVVMVSIATAAGPPFPCSFYARNGYYYDLSNMYRNASQGQQDFSATLTTFQSTFYVNVCGQTVTQACQPANGVCQVSFQGTSYGDGNADPDVGATFGDYRMASSSITLVVVVLLWSSTALTATLPPNLHPRSWIFQRRSIDVSARQRCFVWW